MNLDACVYQSVSVRYFFCVCASDSEGNIDETLQCLEKSADISRSSGLQNKLADICLSLGNIYYNTVSKMYRHTVIGIQSLLTNETEQLAAKEVSFHTVKVLSTAALFPCRVSMSERTTTSCRVMKLPVTQET